jgi:protein-tyrosine-phosphatase
MAEALFRAYLRKTEKNWSDWTIGSAGTWAPNGKPASKNSQVVMAQRGLDISAHRSRMITPEIMVDADLILTMEFNHKEALQMEFPASAKKVFLLFEMAGEQESVADPYGSSLEDYEKTAIIIEGIIKENLTKITALAEKNYLVEKSVS